MKCSPICKFANIYIGGVGWYLISFDKPKLSRIFISSFIRLNTQYHSTILHAHTIIAVAHCHYQTSNTHTAHHTRTHAHTRQLHIYTPTLPLYHNGAYPPTQETEDAPRCSERDAGDDHRVDAAVQPRGASEADQTTAVECPRPVRPVS